MSYKQIHDQFWTDPKIKKLHHEVKYLFAYLITNPHSHYSGIYYLPKAFIKQETGLSDRGIDRGIEALSDGRFMEYDDDCDTVFLVNMVKYQTQGCNLNENQRKGIAKHFSSLHNTPLIKSFLDKYDFLEIEFEYRAMDTPIEGAMDSPNVTVNASVGVVDALKAFNYNDAFESFWTLYPKRNGRKVGKGTTFELFKKISPDDMIDLMTAEYNYSESLLTTDISARDPERFLRKEWWRDWVAVASPELKEFSPECRATIRNLKEWLKERNNVE